MRKFLIMLAVAACTPTIANAENVTANRVSNVVTNNGVVREEHIDEHCVDGWCERIVERRVYRERHGRRDRGHRKVRRNYYYRGD